MFKKRVKFNDFNDVEREQDFYFHLNKTDLMVLGNSDGLVRRMQAAVASKEPLAIMAELESLVLLAYGVRSEDGQEFHKSEEERARFKASPAYDELIIGLMTDPESALEFFRSLMPKSMQGQLDKELANLPTEIPNPFKEPTEVTPARRVIETTEELNADNDMPAWFKEGRKPTRRELVKMDKEEMALAFRLTQDGTLK